MIKQKLLKEPKKRLTAGVRLSIISNHDHYKSMMFFHHENKEFKWRIVYYKNIYSKPPASVSFEIWSDSEIDRKVSREQFIEWLMKNHKKDLECLLFVGAVNGDLKGFETWFEEDSDEEVAEEE